MEELEELPCDNRHEDFPPIGFAPLQEVVSRAGDAALLEEVIADRVAVLSKEVEDLSVVEFGCGCSRRRSGRSGSDDARIRLHARHAGGVRGCRLAWVKHWGQRRKAAKTERLDRRKSDSWAFQRNSTCAHWLAIRCNFYACVNAGIEKLASEVSPLETGFSKLGCFPYNVEWR